MKQKKSVVKVVLSTLLFWVIVFLGPYFLVLWNELSLIRYDQGTLGFLFFATIVQGIAALIAWYAASHVFGGVCCMPAAVNCIVCASFLAFLLTNATNAQEIISGLVTIIALIVGAVSCFRKNEEQKRKEAKELEDSFKKLLEDAKKLEKFDPHK